MCLPIPTSIRTDELNPEVQYYTDVSTVAIVNAFELQQLASGLGAKTEVSSCWSVVLLKEELEWR